MYIIEIEDWEEDIDIYNEIFMTLEDAVKQAQEEACHNKAVGIYKVDEKENPIEEYDIYGNKIKEVKNV